MEEKKAKRKLTAILSADVKGYSHLMQDDEEATVRTITAYRGVMSNLIQEHDGRVVDAKGDNLLAEFPSVVDAVRCGVEIQKELKVRNAELPEQRRMDFRIGINLGDVIEKEGTIYGDGVNIAARIEGLADGGGICISKKAFNEIKNKLSLGYEYLGEHSVKNISEPVSVYKVLMEPEHAGKVIGEDKPKKWRWALVAAVLVIVITGTLGIWNIYFGPPPIESASVDKMAFPLPDRPSIVVLPFDNMSGDPKEDYFSDGLTEQIITTLARYPRLFVIARQSSFHYKGKPVKIRKVAEDLGVRYVLKGCVQKAGDKVRITVQLIDAITGSYIWSERYDRELKEIFDLQDEITFKVLNGMVAELTEGEQTRRWTKRGVTNLKALEKHYRAQGFFCLHTKENYDKARPLFEEAIALEPKFVWPYVYLGYLHTGSVYRGFSEDPAKSIQMAFELAQKALAIDDSHDGPHSLLALIYLLKRQYDKALSEAERAVALNPNASDAFNILGATLGILGRWEESLLYAKKSLRLSPFPGAAPFRTLGSAYFMTGQYDESIVTWKKALKVSPNFLDAHVYLAACYSSMGRDAEARAAAKKVLDINPKFSIESKAKRLLFKNEADIERVVDALRKAGLPDKPPLPLPDKPSIAVLPFDNLSGDPEQDYFAAGLTDDVITRLSRFRDLFVIARNSVFTYKGKTTTAQQAGRELGVRYIMKGGVHKGEEKMRITAQLVDAASGNHVWAHRYERDLKDIFAVQNEIAASIVATLGGLQGQITNVLLERTARKRTDNLKAYDLVLRGDELNIRFTKEANAKARQLFEEAIRLDPNYALAYADLAWNYCFAYMLQFGPSPEEDLQKGFELAKKAISLDDADAESHWILGFAYLMKRDHDRALAAYERARALNPDYADLLADMGYALTCVGRAKEGIAQTERAMRLNPFYPDWYLWIIGMAQYTMHRYEEAVATLKKMTDFPIEPRLYLAASYAQLGRLEEARTELMEILKLDPGATLKSWGDSQPFKNKVDSEHFFDGLRKAGLPE